MDAGEMLELVKTHAGLYEAYHVTTFKGYREAKDGGAWGVTVEVFDAGPGARGDRYHAVATDDRGRRATGDPSDSLDAALAAVHWGELDHHPGL